MLTRTLTVVLETPLGHPGGGGGGVSGGNSKAQVSDTLIVTFRDKSQRFDAKATFADIIVEMGLSNFLSPSPSMLILKTIIPKP